MSACKLVLARVYRCSELGGNRVVKQPQGDDVVELGLQLSQVMEGPVDAIVQLACNRGSPGDPPVGIKF